MAEIIIEPGPDECAYRLGRALRNGVLERGTWGHGFAASILRANKRPGWEPSDKQLYAMRRLLAELSAPDEALIDGDDDA
jgi:hypothetical protein